MPEEEDALLEELGYGYGGEYGGGGAYWRALICLGKRTGWAVLVEERKAHLSKQQEVMALKEAMERFG